MDFSKIKQKAIELKDKAIELKDKTVDMTAEKISKSSLVLQGQEDFDKFILKSENKTFLNQEWETKVFEKRCLVIFWDSSKDFFKEFLLSIPVLLTKSFSQNVALKIVDVKDEKIDIKKYSLSEIPALIVFENKEVYKTITWEDNIKKVVKSLTLDINKTIEEI